MNKRAAHERHLPIGKLAGTSHQLLVGDTSVLLLLLLLLLPGQCFDIAPVPPNIISSSREIGSACQEYSVFTA